MCLCRFAFAIYPVKGESHLSMHAEWQKRNENRTKMHQNFANEINKNIKLKILLFAFLSLHLICMLFMMSEYFYRIQWRTTLVINLVN